MNFFRYVNPANVFEDIRDAFSYEDDESSISDIVGKVIKENHQLKR